MNVYAAASENTSVFSRRFQRCRGRLERRTGIDLLSLMSIASVTVKKTAVSSIASWQSYPAAAQSLIMALMLRTRLPSGMSLISFLVALVGVCDRSHSNIEMAK